MSLAKSNPTSVVKQLYFYKLHAYLGVFSALVAIQLIALLFSFNGISSSASGGGSLTMQINYYSADMVISFTMLWAFIIAITLTTKSYRYSDFTFVSNRFSSNLSSIYFLVTASIAGGITAMLSGVFIKVVMVLINQQQMVLVSSTREAPLELLMGVIATIMYVLLFAAAGYFVGMLTQWNKIMILLLPCLLLALFFLGVLTASSNSMAVATITKIVQFFSLESSLLIFSIKVVLTSLALFTSSILISNRLEVRS